MLEVRLLGQFSLRREGKRLEIPSRPAQSLFAYLVLNPGLRHRRERLAGIFWPDSMESNARNNLRQALWRIRSSIEDEKHQYITSDRFHVGFDPEAETWLDVDVLLEELEENAPVDEWVAVYKGELLPGFYDEWVVPERERLRIAFEQRGEKLLAHLERRKLWSELLDWGENLNARAGALEPAFRAIMRAHFELGDSARSVATYQRCIEALAEYGVEPSVETKQLLERISRGERELPSAAPAPAGDLPAFLKEPLEEERAPFFARGQELTKLGELLEAALEGSGQVAFIAGEAGSGKTALMRELTNRAHADHKALLVARGECNAVTGPGDPYLPFRDVFGCVLSDLESRWSRGLLTTAEARKSWEALPISARVLLEHGPNLVGSLVSLSWLASVARLHDSMDDSLKREIERHAESEAFGESSAEQLQSGLFDECAEVFAGIAARRPLAIVLDDLQWADLGSLDLLFHLCRRIKALPILVLCAYRPDEVALGRDGAPHPLAKVMGELKSDFGDIEIDLSIGPENADRTFIDALIDSEPNELDEAFRSALFEQTGGHPLFTIELLRELEGRGNLVRDSKGRWAQAATLDWGKLPAKVEGVIEERVGRLEPRLLDVLNVASVEGETFTAEVVAPVVGIDERVLIRALSQELDKRHRLTVAKGTGRLNGRRLSLYSFRHRLFQRHIYNRLDEAEKTYLHEAIGKALERLYGDQSGEVAVQLARHFAESGDSVRAIRYLQQAGERARRISANAEAVSHLRRGLLLLGDLPKGHIRDEYELALMISLGAALTATKGYAAPEVEAAFDRARKLCERIGDAPQLFPALWGLWSFHIVRASHSVSLELGQQLRQIAGREPGLLLEAHRALGSTLLYMGEIRQARRHLQKAVELYDPRYHSGHTYHYGQNPLVACMSSLALAFWALGHPEPSLEGKRQALSYAEAIDHPHSLAYALVLSSVLHYSRREWSETLSFAEKAIELSERHGFPLWLAVGRITRGAALSKLGDESGRVILTEGLDDWQANGGGLGLPTYMGMLAEAQFDRGKGAAALETVDRALHLADDTHELISKPELLRLNGEFLRSDSPKGADQYFKRSLRSARAQRSNSMELRTLTSLCQHRIEQGRRHTYRDALRKVYNRFDPGVSTPDLEQARDLLQV
ncbi:MAG: AAA family ATPase [Chloroflexi bacterium]|nr:AAA family ATPase [Chloroflexota bacterium]